MTGTLLYVVQLSNPVAAVATLQFSSCKKRRSQAKVSFEEVDPAVQMEAKDVLAMNAALTALQIVDPRKSRVVELRYFGGFSIEETARALSVSTVTVKRDW